MLLPLNFNGSGVFHFVSQSWIPFKFLPKSVITTKAMLFWFSEAEKSSKKVHPHSYSIEFGVCGRWDITSTQVFYTKCVPIEHTLCVGNLLNANWEHVLFQESVGNWLASIWLSTHEEALRFKNVGELCYRLFLLNVLTTCASPIKGGVHNRTDVRKLTQREEVRLCKKREGLINKIKQKIHDKTRHERLY